MPRPHPCTSWMQVSSSQFADDAAAYAVQQLSSQSNSLYPFSLKEVRVGVVDGELK